MQTNSRVLLVISFTMGSVIGCHKLPDNKIPNSVIATWEEHGAVSMWCGKTNNHNWTFDVSSVGLQDAVPAFWLPPKTTDTDLLGLRVIQSQSFGLYLQGAKITDAGLNILREQQQIVALDLSYTEVTDEGLKELNALSRFTYLNLQNTPVTDLGLKHLKKLQHLTVLDLHSTKVTDAGVKEFEEFKELAYVELHHTKVTDAGLKTLEGFNRIILLDVHLPTKP